MAFLHTCKTEIGLCDCGCFWFYKPETQKDIKDNLYDWVLIGSRWTKLKNCTLSIKTLIECDCVFAYEVS